MICEKCGTEHTIVSCTVEGPPSGNTVLRDIACDLGRVQRRRELLTVATAIKSADMVASATCDSEIYNNSDIIQIAKDLIDEVDAFMEKESNAKP